MHSNPPLPNWTALRHAIVVCGHAVYCGGPNIQPLNNAKRDEYWILQPFQKGEGADYISHIKAGVKLASEDPQSLLMFSGGQTRIPAILSEAQGYHDIASAFDFWGHYEVRARTTTEEFSRDSFDNVLFSIARFYECVGEWPQHLTIVSWKFKEARFGHHAWSIHWPINSYTFHGVGVPEDLEKAEVAESRTRQYFEKDAFGYGKENGSLGVKKEARNPYQRHHGYISSCPAMTDVLKWRCSYRISERDVPWAKVS